MTILYDFKLLLAFHNYYYFQVNLGQPVLSSSSIVLKENLWGTGYFAGWASFMLPNHQC